jgi:two-component system, sensor histidine kinase and response regulator
MTGLILIVDDQPTNLEIICETLGNVGLEVAIATSGERALQQIAREQPDLILLDIIMPGMDGFETFQRLKADSLTCDVPVIFMTALADTENKVKALELGAVDYVTKPFQEQEVLARVRTHLHQVTLVAQLTQLAEEAKQAAILEERNRMAREIHDTLAQSFTSILMRLQTAELDLPDRPEVMHNLQLACELARQGLAEARRSVYALRPQPLEQKSFSEALQRCLEDLVTPAQIAYEFCLSGKLKPLPEHMEDELLRIAQEAIRNACKHAAANKIEVHLTAMPSKICLVVRDDGKGFAFAEPSTREGFGLISMRERVQQLGGKFALSSQLEQGTEIIVEVELPL